MFKTLISDSIFAFLKENRLLNSNQSQFNPNDSCINQLISITHNIFKGFNANPWLEVREDFLDLSKSFDRVWHAGLLNKLKNNGIDVNLYNLI